MKIDNILMHKNDEKKFNCRVCGLDQGIEPWGDDGQTPTFDICDCCGVQFGYQDCDEIYVKKFRNHWIDNGAKWSFPKGRPENWVLKEQLKQIPDEFSDIFFLPLKDDSEKLKLYLEAKFEFCNNILFFNLVRKPSVHEIINALRKMRKNQVERLYNHFYMSSITDDIVRQKQYCIEIWTQWRSYFNEHMPEKQIIIEIIDQISEIIICVYESG